MLPLTPVPGAPIPPSDVAAPPQPAPSAAGSQPQAAPILGAAAVTSLRDGANAAGPGRRQPAEPPPEPPILKGLNVPPLDLRRVGDGDKIDPPAPPPAQDLRALVAQTDDRAAARMDIRR